MEKVLWQARVNGEEVSLAVSSHLTLAELLREHLHCKEIKIGCDGGECGLCALWVNGKVRLACLTLALQCQGAEIETLPQFLQTPEGEALAQAFLEEGALQCGFCTPSMLMVLGWLLKQRVTDLKKVRKALVGQFCRCTGYGRMEKAYERAKNQLGF